MDEIVSSSVTDAEQIALRERCTVRQVNMTISLAFLAPKLVRVAVEGRLPRGSASAAALRGLLSALRDFGHGCPAASGRLLQGAVGRAGAQHGGDLRIPLHWDFIALVGVGVSRPAKSRSTARRWEAEMTVERRKPGASVGGAAPDVPQLLF